VPIFSLAMSFSSTTFRYAGLDNFTVSVRGGTGVVTIFVGSVAFGFEDEVKTEKKGNENEIVTKSR